MSNALKICLKCLKIPFLPLNPWNKDLKAKKCILRHFKQIFKAFDILLMYFMIFIISFGSIHEWWNRWLGQWEDENNETLRPTVKLLDSAYAAAHASTWPRHWHHLNLCASCLPTHSPYSLSLFCSSDRGLSSFPLCSTLLFVILVTCDPFLFHSVSVSLYLHFSFSFVFLSTLTHSCVTCVVPCTRALPLSCTCFSSLLPVFSAYAMS